MYITLFSCDFVKSGYKFPFGLEAALTIFLFYLKVFNSVKQALTMNM